MTTPPSRPAARLRKWAIRLAVAVVLLAALYACRQPLLRGVGGCLVVDEPAQPGDVVLLLDADGGYKEAAQAYGAGATPRVLLLETPPGRLQRLSILETEGERQRKALLREAVRDDAVTSVACPGRGDWNRARGLREWLMQNPNASVVVLSDRMNSRRLRRIFRTILGADLAGRVRWRAVPHRWYDETNWWTNKAGLSACVNGYLGLAHVCLYGEKQGEREWDPDQFEQTLPHRP
jgi:hypothetical protein